MSVYIVNSARVGTVGEIYTPAAGTDIQRLLDGNFIVERKTTKTKNANITHKAAGEPETTEE